MNLCSRHASWLLIMKQDVLGEANTRHCIDMGIPGVVTERIRFIQSFQSHMTFSLRFVCATSYYQSKQSRIKPSTSSFLYLLILVKLNPLPSCNSQTQHLSHDHLRIEILLVNNPDSHALEHPLHLNIPNTCASHYTPQTPTNNPRWPQQRTTTTSTSP